jgi:DNA-binding transcriptional LysR family regulator
MDHASHLPAFVAAAELLSFSAAARKLGLSRDQVSKQVAALEAELGAPLFQRSTRAMTLTPAGETLLERARTIVRLLDEALVSVGGLQDKPRGPLRVNAPMSFGQRYLAPLLPGFLSAHPEVQLRLDLDDRFVDPAKSGADVTLRIAQLPPDLDLVARPLATAPRWLVAAPSYLDRWGAPKHPQDVALHACLHYGDASQGSQWQFRRGEELVNVPAKGPICSNNGDVLLQSAESGLGLTVLPNFLLQTALDSGRLQAVLSDWQVTPDIGVFALHAPGSRSLPAVRAFVAYLEQQFAR